VKKDLQDAVTIVDYGMGNIRSIANAFKKLGIPFQISANPKEIQKSTRVLLPGVGAIRDCMANLEKLGLLEPVTCAARDALKPSPFRKRFFLGICLGLQVLFEESEEFGQQKGLGIFEGKVLGLKPKKKIKIPHIGWNQLNLSSKLRKHPLWRDISSHAQVYFVHSYHVKPRDHEIIAAQTHHGQTFVSAIQKNGLLATQFHPEKSQDVGLQILQNFSQWSRGG
jgi:glutamine amidotransferase